MVEEAGPFWSEMEKHSVEVFPRGRFHLYCAFIQLRNHHHHHHQLLCMGQYSSAGRTGMSRETASLFSESSTSTRCRLDVFSGNGCLKLIVWFHADFTMAGKSRITIATEANILTHTCCNLPGHMLKFTSHWSCPERRGVEKKDPHAHTHTHSQGTGNTTVLSLVLSLCFFLYILAHILIPRKQRFALFAFELNFPRAS